MWIVTGLLKRLGFIAVMALALFGAGNLWWSYQRGAAMQRYGVASRLSPVVDACLDALSTFHKKFKAMPSHEGCACAVGVMAKAPTFEEKAATFGIRALVGPRPALPEQFGMPFPPRAQATEIAPDRVVRAAISFGDAIKQCSGDGMAAAPQSMARAA